MYGARMSVLVFGEESLGGRCDPPGLEATSRHEVLGIAIDLMGI